MLSLLSRSGVFACFTVIFLLVAGVSATAFAADVKLTPEERDWIARSGPVKVWGGDWPPYQFKDTARSGICDGYLKLITEKTGLRFEVVPAGYSWDEMLRRMRKGTSQYDVIPTIKRTEEREEFLRFTRPYLYLSWVIVIRDDFGYVGGPDDLAGMTVAVQNRYVVHQRLAEQYPRLNLIPVPDAEKGLESVARGSADAFVGNLTVTSWLIDHRGFDVLKVAAPITLGNHDQRMAVAREDRILASVLDKALASITPLERQALMQEWMAVRYEHGMSLRSIIRWLLVLVLPLGAALLVMAFSNRRLRRERDTQLLMQRELQESREALDRVIKGIRAAIVTVEPRNLSILDANEEAEKLLGWSREELKGRDCRFLCCKGGDKNCPERCPLLEQDIFMGEYLIARADGTCVPIMKTVVSVRREGQAAFMEVMLDISERKRHERDQLQALKLESIGSLAAGIAHEINTPAQFVGDNVRFLKEELDPFMKRVAEAVELACPDPTALDDKARSRFLKLCEDSGIEFLAEEVPQAIRETLEGVGRITGIVRSMKAFSHPDEVNPVPLDVTEAVRNTVMVARNEWKYVAEVNFDFEENLPPVRVVPGQFNQVVLNLLINAAQAIAEKNAGTQQIGSITISARRDGKMVQVSVTDTGTGIPKEMDGRVFDPFFTTKEVGKGTGQGLAIAYSLVVETFGGELFFESAEGEGTTFHIRIPAEV
ncbi:ATP-binding protein [Desulfovibrio oxyclinae]|uniref:ATP-binding protein n=1 Tax=Desulfovibrio oxyclinae TaxID=63560 RepID=UPI0003635DD1|nr:transporter substrate-binding domain-containing protein [Desulfovibrio oxyclinae]